jgi:hypothetical protein
MDSIAAQVGQIMEDFREEDEEAEPEKPANDNDGESKSESAVKVSK